MLGTAIGLWIGLLFIGWASRRFKNHRAFELRLAIACIGAGLGAILTLLMYLFFSVMAEYPFEPTPWYAVEFMMGVTAIAFALVTGFCGLMFVPDLRDKTAFSAGGYVQQFLYPFRRSTKGLTKKKIQSDVGA